MRFFKCDRHRQRQMNTTCEKPHFVRFSFILIFFLISFFVFSPSLNFIINLNPDFPLFLALFNILRNQSVHEEANRAYLSSVAIVAMEISHTWYFSFLLSIQIDLANKGDFNFSDHSHPNEFNKPIKKAQSIVLIQLNGRCWKFSSRKSIKMQAECMVSS